MNLRLLLLLPLLAACLHAEPQRYYQVTGPIVALTDTVITVQKGEERWEIARSPATRVDGMLALGQRVTVQYRMAADKINVKTPPSTEKADRAAQKAAEKADRKASK